MPFQLPEINHLEYTILRVLDKYTLNVEDLRDAITKYNRKMSIAYMSLILRKFEKNGLLRLLNRKEKAAINRFITEKIYKTTPEGVEVTNKALEFYKQEIE